MDAATEQKYFCDNKKKIQGKLNKLDMVLARAIIKTALIFISLFLTQPTWRAPATLQKSPG